MRKDPDKKTVYRCRYVFPKSGELFYMRCCLHTKPWLSFEDMKACPGSKETYAVPATIAESELSDEQIELGGCAFCSECKQARPGHCACLPRCSVCSRQLDPPTDGDFDSLDDAWRCPSVAASFHDVAEGLGLLCDKEWIKCLCSAHSIAKTKEHIRALFVVLMNEGMDAAAALKDKKVRRALGITGSARLRIVNPLLDGPDPVKQRENAVLRDLADRCVRAGYKESMMRSRNFPEVQRTNLTELEVVRQVYADCDDLARQLAYMDEHAPVTDQIRSVGKTIFDAATGKGEQCLFYVQGRAGAGKTLCLNRLRLELQRRGKVVLCCAYSGVAALNYHRGSTVHNLFQFAPGKREGSVKSTEFSKQRRELVRAADLIIIDEISMAQVELMRDLDQKLQDLLGNTLCFGGKVIVLAGDFLQLPPVVKDGNRGDA